MTELAIEASGLVKSFGPTRAVDGVDLTVAPGGVYGFLGPNGAGKTTTIRMLATLLRPDGGTARVLGHDIARESAAVRDRVRLTGQFASVDEELTGRENLVLLGRLLGCARAQARARSADLLDVFGLDEVADRLVKTYSGGLRRRLDVAASVVIPPDLLFLDEPTTGLDPHSRSQVWDVVRALVRNGTTVLLTTQYLDEADQLADRVAVIDHGRIIAEGTCGELKSSVGSGTVRVRLDVTSQRPTATRVLAQVLGAPVRAGSDPAVLTARLPAATHQTGERVAEALSELSRAGVVVDDLTLGQPSLDEVFLALTGHTAGRDPDQTAEEAA
jgi:ABC-2 type transport system ATP-binding protein